MARVAEVLYRLKDYFSKPAQKIMDGYRDIRRSSRRTADSVSKDASQLSAAYGKVSKTLANVRNFVIGITALGGLTSQLKRTANELDNIGKTAQKLGVTTEELSALGYAAERNNVAFSSLATAIQRMTRRSAEAAQGTGEAKAALEELGIDARRFVQLSLEDKMAELADAFGAVGSQADRVRLAFKLFDTEGVDLVRVLQGGSQELRKLIAEADRFGAVIDQQQSDAAARFNDATTNFTNRVKAARNTSLAPFFENLSDVMDRLGLGDRVAELDAEIESLKRNLSGEAYTSIFDIDFRSEEEQRAALKAAVAERDRLVNAEKSAVEQSKEEQAARKEQTESIAQYKQSVSGLTEVYKTNTAELKKQLQTETAELAAARREQASIEQQFKQLKDDITAPPKGDVFLADVFNQINQAQRALNQGSADEAIRLAQQGGDLLGQLKEKGTELPAVLGYLADRLAKVANAASEQKVDAELVDTEAAKAQLASVEGQMKQFVEQSKQMGAEAGKAFVEAMQAQLNATLQPPTVAPVAKGVSPIHRQGSSFSDRAFSDGLKDELTRRGSR
jgi:chromosome segregation ATPase